MCLWRLVVDGIVLLVSVISAVHLIWLQELHDLCSQLVSLSYYHSRFNAETPLGITNETIAESKTRRHLRIRRARD